MKEIFMAVAIFAILFAGANFVEAKSLTSEQFEKVADYIGRHPSSSPENTVTLKLDTEQFKQGFNAELKPILTSAKFDSDEVRQTMEKLFYIQDYKVFHSEIGNLYVNIFGDKAAILGVTGKDDAHFKTMCCTYAAPENREENTLSSLVLVSFVRTLLPGIEFESFMKDLSSSQGKPFTRDGIKFSLGKEDNLVVLTAVAE